MFYFNFFMPSNIFRMANRYNYSGGERNPVAVSMPHLNSLSGRLGETYVNYPQIDMVVIVITSALTFIFCYPQSSQNNWNLEAYQLITW